VGDGNPHDGFGPIPNDSEGTICPAAAHIRKVNPRDHDTDQGGSNVTLTKRILRRGIPYGRPLASGATADDENDRGLLFVSYQRSIGQQFEFLSKQWMNSAFNPQSGSDVGGFDLLVGQNASSPTRSRQCKLPIGSGGAAEVVPSSNVAFQQYVNPTGAAYFFAPSITALRDVLTEP
jgi:deferrochelatase/peroxidase EfeB